MTDLVERYVHQVGRYLPSKIRTEIEMELRSQIEDQLEDRFAGSASQEETASLLAEFGHPYKIATSYTGERSLVGPMLYPFMMMVLRRVWVLIPAIVVFLNVFSMLTSPQQDNLITFLVQTAFAVLQAVFTFSSVVILIFALIERTNFKEMVEPFEPFNLPEINDPRALDRFETVFEIVFGTVITLIFLYFLRIGGLTLRFDLNDPGEVIPVPDFWLILISLMALAMILIHLLVLRRNRWSTGTWFIQTVLEFIGGLCMYFVLYKPVFERIVVSHPSLAEIPIIASAPELLVIISGVLMLVGKGNRLIELWNYRPPKAAPFSIHTNAR